jgi:hypothetical protein
MVEQLKAVKGNSVTYGTHVKGSTRVVLVWKYQGEVQSFDGSIVEHDRLRIGQTFREYMVSSFVGDILPVTGLPGKR